MLHDLSVNVIDCQYSWQMEWLLLRDDVWHSVNWKKHLGANISMFSFTVDEHFEAEWCIYAAVKWAIIGSDNSFSPVQCPSIILAQSVPT